MTGDCHGDLDAQCHRGQAVVGSGRICLFESQTGTPISIMDGAYLTAMRTAGAAALSTRLLARKDTDKLAIIGAGVQGASHLGSGSLEVDSSLLVVAMEEENQTSDMHHYRFRERESITNEASISLTERIIPAFYMCCFTRFFAYLC